MFNPDTAFTKIADVTNKFIVCVGMDGNYSYANNAFFKKFGLTKSDLVGRHSLTDIHPEEHQLVKDTVTRCCMNVNSAFDIIIRKPTKKGGYIYTKWDFIAMPDVLNQPDYIMCVGMEITSYVEDAAANMLRLQEIAYDQSHLVRRPLANILGLSQMLIDVRLDSEAERNMLLSQLYQLACELDEVVKSVSDKALK